jgi:soluble lytic murein transglycosylase-like protein
MNTESKIILLGLAGLATYYIINNQTAVETAAQAAASDLEAATMGWKNAGSGPTWVPILNEAEAEYGLPQDILAATAYQESSFIENVIRGLVPSSDGLSLGIMQLQTQYYPALVGPGVPTPYTDQNVSDQINQAAQVFASNYAVLQSWEGTIAAWNQGLTGVERNGITSTQYVANIIANAPSAAVS